MKNILTHVGAGAIGLLLGVVIMLLVELRKKEEPGVAFKIEENRLYQVDKVIDGDTVVLDNLLHVRLLGINAPEVGRYVTEPTPYSAAATNRLKELINGRKVTLLFGNRQVDPHGRILANIYIPPEMRKEGDPEPQDSRGVWVDEVMVREGLAEADTFFGDDGGGYIGSAKLKQAQQQAKDAKAGMWSLSDTSALVNETSDGRPFLFVAASNSLVFHEASGGTGAKITPRHKLGWPDLISALASGRRPNQNLRKKIDTELNKIDTDPPNTKPQK